MSTSSLNQQHDFNESPQRKTSISGSHSTLGRKSSIVETIQKLGSKDSIKRLASGSQMNLFTPSEDHYSMNPSDYEIGSPIGYGSSAVVYLAKYKPLNKNVAIKMIDLDMFERNQIDELRREIQIMSLSKHPNLLQVHGSFVNESKLYIVTPFFGGGSCLDIMKTSCPDGFEEVSIATILKQVLQGLEYLHKNGLIHRDVKAGNLLVDDDGTTQLADFGVSSSLMDTGERKGSRKTFVGTPCWMAPEVMEQSGYDYKADIWSFGITSLELATGRAPFAKYAPMKVLLLTLQNDPPTLDREKGRHRYSKSFKEMIDSCLQKNPAKRPTAEKLLQHPFFKQAKKSSYLVQSILQNLGPIQNRAHNRKSFSNVTTEERKPKTIDSWDFSAEVEAEEKEKPRTVRFDSVTQIVDNSPAETSSYAVNEPINHQATAPKKSRFILDTKGNSNSVGSPAEVAASNQSPQVSTLSQQQQQPVSQTAQSNALSPTLPPQPVLAVNLNNFNVVASSPASNMSVNSGGTFNPLNAEVKRGRFTDKRGRFQVSSVDINNNNRDTVRTVESSNAGVLVETTSNSSQGSPSNSPPNTVSRNARFTAVSANSKSQADNNNNMISLFHSRLNLLVEQNEQQKIMLKETLSSLQRNSSLNMAEFNNNLIGSALTSDPSQSSVISISSAKRIFDDIPQQNRTTSVNSVSSTFIDTSEGGTLGNNLNTAEVLDTLKFSFKSFTNFQLQLQEIFKENEALKLENEFLKKEFKEFKVELDELKKKVQESGKVES
ncbi:hypothetical protein HK099_004337 [Clydaea vesicula]|uniref:Protein kinase domain-containing protein n=1 Tax=Clydaea vesicula TaxID=447962 RepID=A0AAD5U0N2_9FUNG|nr:hypothetical protein HK099_004337 [Clydaea vesicula]